MIPLSVIDVGDEELRAVKEVLDSGWLTEGVKNREFEERFAEYIGVKKAVALNSCTSALFLAVKALNITGEVILPSFTFVASANAVVTAGAMPVFADVNYETCNIDPHDIEKKITKRTQAIMPVHFGGLPAEMEAIVGIARKHNLRIIEDSAETIGGEYGGKKTGSYDIGCFSFFPTKSMTTGEGGMLTTGDADLSEKIKTLAGHGVSKGDHKNKKGEKPWSREAVLAGYNFRMSDILAAIGVEQLKKIEKMNSLRRQHAGYLTAGLAGLGIDLPVESAGCRHVYQMYTVKTGRERDRVVLRLREMGVGASVHFDPPAHLQPYYMDNFGCRRGDLPATERLADSILTLPMYPQMKRPDLDFIISAMKEVL
ncbi:MAG: DegT/DnrJ/EryC1/StrS family aminotransferase [Pseudomonadota bacterium]